MKKVEQTGLTSGSGVERLERGERDGQTEAIRITCIEIGTSPSDTEPLLSAASLLVDELLAKGGWRAVALASLAWAGKAYRRGETAKALATFEEASAIAAAERQLALWESE